MADTPYGLPPIVADNLIIPSVLFVSALAVVGLLALSVRAQKLSRILLYMVSFSAGGLLGDAFLHLLPETVEEAGGFTLSISLVVLFGIVAAFLLEKFVHWHHHNTADHAHHHDRPAPFAFMILFGDFLHNTVDGMIIAASYLVSIPLGIATTLAVAAHEIPQEIGDFGVLLHAGMSKARALAMNLLSAGGALLGAGFVLVVGEFAEGLVEFLVPFAVGNFVYIACSDLIPELHKEKSTARSIGQVAALLAGIGAMAALLLLEGSAGHAH